MAFAYKLEKKSLPYATHIASYALGKDYHDSIRQNLFPIIEKYKAKLGGEWRICIDSAPIAERYWASKAGIGKIGKNGCIIVDEGGSAVFLAEILTTLYFEPDLKEPYESFQGQVNCRECGRCIEACPTGALLENGRIDSNRCISYLTIEKRGEWTAEEKEIMELPASSQILFGCDICVKCCPMNGIPDRYYVEDDDIYQELKEITEEDILNLSKPDFKKKFGKTPLFRATYEGIVRNALNVKKSKSNK